MKTTTHVLKHLFFSLEKNQNRALKYVIFEESGELFVKSQLGQFLFLTMRCGLRGIAAFW